MVRGGDGTSICWAGAYGGGQANGDNIAGDGVRGQQWRSPLSLACYISPYAGVLLLWAANGGVAGRWRHGTVRCAAKTRRGHLVVVLARRRMAGGKTMGERAGAVDVA